MRSDMLSKSDIEMVRRTARSYAFQEDGGGPMLTHPKDEISLMAHRWVRDDKHILAVHETRR